MGRHKKYLTQEEANEAAAQQRKQYYLTHLEDARKRNRAAMKIRRQKVKAIINFKQYTSLETFNHIIEELKASIDYQNDKPLLEALIEKIKELKNTIEILNTLNQNNQNNLTYIVS